jgi:hypothetical protein
MRTDPGKMQREVGNMFPNFVCMRRDFGNTRKSFGDMRSRSIPMFP